MYNRPPPGYVPVPQQTYQSVPAYIPNGPVYPAPPQYVGYYPPTPYYYPNVVPTAPMYAPVPQGPPPPYAATSPPNVNHFELQEVNQHNLYPTIPSTTTATEPTSSVDEVLDVKQKRCKRCNRFYKEDEQSSATCKYHSGVYRNVYSSTFAVGRYSSWSCCSEPTRDALGCKVGVHVEDLTMTDKMANYAKMLRQVPKRDLGTSPESDDLIDLKFDDKLAISPPSVSSSSKQRVKLDIDDVIKHEEGGNFIKHHVKMTDTVVGLSMKYKIPSDQLKKINKLTSDQQLWSRTFIKIPAEGRKQEEPSEAEKAQIQAELIRRLVRRFKRNTQSKSDEEAMYYLTTCNFRYDEAVAEYNADIAFEKSNPIRRKSKLVR